DPLDGLTDIAERRITFIGDPYERIKEDYLRILRFFRFAALFSTNKKFLAIEISALSDLRDGLDTISAERKSDEIFKLFAAPNLIFSISLMEKTNIISKVFHTYYFNCLATLQDIENRHEISPCATRRLAAYTEDNLKLHLRFSNKTANTHKFLRDEAKGPKGAAELSYRYSEKLALDIILVRASLKGTEFSKDILSQIKLGSAVEFPIKSSDLAKYFSGAKLGKMLKLLEQKWIESDFTLNKQKLLSTIT
ncbi:MAG: CCA tRNA nucleotidyltransferase, partial [Paracoccaceae bacterium]